ncbi:RhuM family protein [Dyadobacter luticola]|uniref:Type II toxin-antitoxin system death-on-curing family toxin n=1 Tax=Dyadobacter luticola TaxID=1979387 RepID=A0A5R9KWC7_9BACT|nr:RhuM family protein [Dyadobacter luticola]TLV00399.1 type II toxin-antitoxin system death-on-curing family toxin [Dyadobacter luticola]
MEKQIEIYESADGGVQMEVSVKDGTTWLSQKQIATLFGTEVPAISKHIRNIFNSNELVREATVSKMEIVAVEGKRHVSRELETYNLDMILSIGYRVNSGKATQFRIWATQRLKEYLVQGYSINEQRLAQKNQQVQTLKDGIRILSRAIESKVDEADMSWLAHFAKGLELLDDYDHEALDQNGISQRAAVYPDLSSYQNIIETMRQDFDSFIFGKEKDDSFRSSVAQISKGFGEIDFYPSIEEKAATLLYLIIKNHSFVDGNKRIAAACFLLFLEVNGLLKSGENAIISNEALASLTLFAAASKPEEMETVKKLIISVLNRNQ